MPIDFFLAPCNEVDCHCQFPKLPGRICRKTTANEKFGLCDDPPPEKLPAYIQEYRRDEWIAEVDNPDSKTVTFKAIDNCVPVLRANEEVESCCDGLLLQDNNLTFVELKDRRTQGWLAKARSQITITIENFIANHDIAEYNITEAYACNKQRPFAITSSIEEVQKFKDETEALLYNNGLLLKVDRNIQI
jgi:hypothetical protein